MAFYGTVITVISWFFLCQKRMHRPSWISFI